MRVREKERNHFGKKVFCMIAVSAILSGCGKADGQVVTVTHPAYEKIVYQTTEVKQGDLVAAMTVKVVAEGYAETVYFAPKEGFSLQQVHVAVGDRVEAGDIMVSFESEQITQTIAGYEDEISRKELLAQHYEKLMAADKEADYTADIKMLREDIRVAELYVEEAEKLLEDYQVVAKEDGVITDVSDYLQNKVTGPGVELVTLVSGTGRYLATVSEPEMFSVGEIYVAEADGIEYALSLSAIEEKTLVFKPVSGTDILSDAETMTIAVELPGYQDAIYVNRHAVCTIKGEDGEDDTYCVYIVQENGYQRAAFVTPGERIGDNIVIVEGLSGGEKVVIR